VASQERCEDLRGFADQLCLPLGSTASDGLDLAQIGWLCLRPESLGVSAAKDRAGQTTDQTRPSSCVATLFFGSLSTSGLGLPYYEQTNPFGS
jgi:hypothetical protein